MAKVASETTGPKFKKPVSTSPPLEAYFPEYLARKGEVTEKLFTLKNGRQLCYFTEGDPSDPACLCLPALGESKWGYLFPAPLTGVYLIAIDRIGHGGSSPLTANEQWSDQCAEVLELIDSLGVDKFAVTGISTGGSHTIMMAAAYPDRVTAIAPVSAPCDWWHSTVTDAQRKTFDCSHGLLPAVYQTGCVAACKRSMARKISAMSFVKDKTADYGFADWWGQIKAGGGSKEACEECEKDPFFVTKVLDSHLYGNNTPMNFYHTTQLLYKKWDMDTAKVKCPTFFYHGKHDAEAFLVCAEQSHKLIEGSELLAFEQHGHFTIFMYQDKIINALVKGTSDKTIPGLK